MAELTLQTLNEQINALKVGERLRIENVSEELYHTSVGYGSTLIKAASKTLADFKYKCDKKWEPTYTQSTAFRVGRATHCMVLEPDLYDDKFIEMPEDIKRKAGSKWEAFSRQHEGKSILGHTDQETVAEMANAVLDSVGERFIDGLSEVSFWYRHETDLILKARIDYLKDNIITDLKTNKADTPHQFARIVKYDYDIQDAQYTLVSGIDQMEFVGVSKKGPYSVFLAKQGERVRQRAHDKLSSTLDNLAFALEFDDFPSYPVEVIETQLTTQELMSA